MIRLPAASSLALRSLVPLALLGVGASAAFALPPEPASAPAGAHVAAPPPAAAGGASTPGITPLGNNKSPMDITADGVEVLQPQHLTIFKGNVEVINDTTRLRTPELRVWNKPKAPTTPGQPAPAAANTGGAFGADSGGIDHIEAAGPVYYITPTQNARGDAMLYEATPDIITLTGHVVLVQGKSVARGDKLIMYRKTGQNQLIANAPQNPAGRVRVILYPQDQQQGAAKPGAPAPAAAKPPRR